jgi:hypothetical protein
LSRAAIQDGAGVWNDAALNIEKGHFFALLEERQITCFASVTDNSGAFVVMDEVAQEAGVLHVPLPAFFHTSANRSCARRMRSPVPDRRGLARAFAPSRPGGSLLDDLPSPASGARVACSID